MSGEPIPVPQPLSEDEVRAKFPLEPLTTSPVESKSPVVGFEPLIVEPQKEATSSEEAFNLVDGKVQSLFDKLLAEDSGIDSTLRGNLEVVLPWVKGILVTAQKNPLEQNAYHLTDAIVEAQKK